jgi:hypothetical protein
MMGIDMASVQFVFFNLLSRTLGPIWITKEMVVNYQATTGEIKWH